MDRPREVQIPAVMKATVESRIRSEVGSVATASNDLR